MTRPTSPAPITAELTHTGVYGFPVDMWAVGCILAELLGRKPLFRGASRVEQLMAILSVLGSPTHGQLETLIPSESVRATLKQLPPRAPRPWTEVFPSGSPMALDLLSKLLVFDQGERLSVDEALAHPLPSPRPWPSSACGAYARQARAPSHHHHRRSSIRSSRFSSISVTRRGMTA